VHYEIEIVVPREYSVQGDTMDEITKSKLFRCGGGPVDSVYGYKFASEKEAELAKSRVLRLIPQSTVRVRRSRSAHQRP